MSALEHDVVGIHRREGAFTSGVGSIMDRAFVKRAMSGVEVLFNAATLHKPHLATVPGIDRVRNFLMEKAGVHSYI